MRKILVGMAAAAIAVSCFGTAQAATVIANSCVSVTAADGCLFSGNINTNTNGNSSYLLAEAAYNTFNNTHPSADPDITLTPIGDSSNGDGHVVGTQSGTWSLPGFMVDFIAVKAGDFFDLYELTPESSGTWTTADISVGNGQQPDLSHIVFFGSPSAVPEPAAWIMMMVGFGFVGAAMRSKGKLVKA
jgi:PEP-CTERM motif